MTKNNSVSSVALEDHSEGMNYLVNLPRQTITVYIPLFLITTVLLFHQHLCNTGPTRHTMAKVAVCVVVVAV